MKRRGTAIGDRPEKQGGAEVLLGKHRGLTALMCCSRRERQAWPRRHRAGTLNSERTGRRERPAVVSETRGHCCACPSPSKAPRASFLSGWWSSSAPWPVSVLRASLSISGLCVALMPLHLLGGSAPAQPGLGHKGRRGLRCPFSEASFNING